LFLFAFLIFHFPIELEIIEFSFFMSAISDIKKHGHR